MARREARPLPMRQKRKHGFLIAIFTILAILLLTGVLLSFHLPEKGTVGIENVTAPPAPAAIVPQERFVRNVTAALPGKAYCSERMNGVFLDLSADIAASDTAEGVLAQLYACFLRFRDCDADTLFLRPDDSGRFDRLSDENGAPFDLTACAVSYAETYGYYTVLCVSDGMLAEEGRFDFTRVSDAVLRYRFHAVYYQPESRSPDAGFFATAEQIRKEIDASGLPVAFGCAVYSEPSLLSEPGEDALSFFAGNTADFVCVHPSGSRTEDPSVFGADLSAWNAFASRYPDVVFFCALSLDDAALASDPENAVASRIELLFDQEYFRGSVCGPALTMLREAGVMRQISEYCYRENKFRFAVNSLTVSGDGGTVVFGGNAVEGRKLIIDRTVIAQGGGPFAVSCVLPEGLNRFALSNAGFTDTFLIEKVADAAPGQTPSPYADNGLGRALMCRICGDAAEPMSYAGDYDTYHPDFSDLPAGTLDYVKRIAFDEGIRYELECGMSVAASEAALLCNGYVMPVNRVSCVRAEEGLRKTDLILETDWAVPFSLTLSGQPYRKGFADFSFNIDSFSSDYLDIVFYHTGNLSLPDGLAFDDSSPVLRAETVVDGPDRVTLRLHLKDGRLYCGASASYDGEGRLILSVKKRPASPASARVMLDPGHGGSYMTGTALNDDSLSEKDVTLDLALKVRELLRAKGIEVRLTREADVSLTLRERKEMCGAYDPDLFVSIHCDGVDDMGQSGTHSFYYKPFSRPLAERIHGRLVDVYANVIYSSADRNYSQIDKSVKYYPFYVTRVDNCPSVLVESGFMSNDFEGMILADDNCRMWIAGAIAEGISDYLNAG